MNKELFMFSYDNKGLPNEDKELIQIGVDITKNHLNRESNDLFLRYSINESDINQEVKEKFRKTLLKRAFEKGNETNYDLDNPESIVEALTNPMATRYLFSIISKIANEINSNTEVQEALMFAEVVKVGMGDSYTKNIESKALYKIQEHSYGNNVTRFQKHIMQPITISPKLKSAGVKFNMIQMSNAGYDFGSMIAKIVKSFRSKMYQDVVDTIYTVDNVSSTPFYLATFAKTTYVPMVDQLEAVNGGFEVIAYGTKSAFMNQTNGITSGFTTQDEINKRGYFTDAYGVRGALVSQAVNTNSSSYTTRVPNNYLLLLSNISEKPVVLARGSGLRILQSDGTTSGLYEKEYIMMEDWNTKLMTSAHYGIVKVAT